MGVGITAFAIGVLRIVVAIVDASVHHLLEEPLHVVQECVLPLINEDSGGGVQSLQMNETIADAALTDDFIDTLSHVG